MKYKLVSGPPQMVEEWLKAAASMGWKVNSQSSSSDNNGQVIVVVILERIA